MSFKEAYMEFLSYQSLPKCKSKSLVINVLPCILMTLAFLTNISRKTHKDVCKAKVKVSISIINLMKSLILLDSLVEYMIKLTSQDIQIHNIFY